MASFYSGPFLPLPFTSSIRAHHNHIVFEQKLKPAGIDFLVRIDWINENHCNHDRLSYYHDFSIPESFFFQVSISTLILDDPNLNRRGQTHRTLWGLA
jgi:hypothetical protein